MEFAELELEAEKRLEDLKRQLGVKALILQGKRPSGLIASMIYILAREKGFFNIYQKQVAEAYGITEVTVHNKVKLLKRLMGNPAMKFQTMNVRMEKQTKLTQFTVKVETK